MKIRDSYAEINGEKETIEMPSGALDVIADDGRTLFCIKLEDGAIEVSTASFCKHEGRLYDTPISIKPRASNVVRVIREKWKDSEKEG